MSDESGKQQLPELDRMNAYLLVVLFTQTMKELERPQTDISPSQIRDSMLSKLDQLLSQPIHNRVGIYVDLKERFLEMAGHL